MFEVRQNEPAYAKLNDPTSQAQNQYGNPIDTVSESSDLRGESLNINDDKGVSDNPNRYKQHGFFFNADNCIACHACETACSEKNDVPAHLSFRSVGFVEGGTYPAYQRINISLACNHCDDPVCLKGCPTRAYTKFAEYGAVLQDPGICFGCGYCTWVCPYNAPQLDPEAGHVSKCNMCVDRLEVGLKPACVSACLGEALDFGVIENIPDGQTQAKTSIPGFPRNDITQPNIRFQQTKATQREMTRCDDMPVKYHRDDAKGEFSAKVDQKHGDARRWNWRKLLLSHESSHTIFTLTSQAVIGAMTLLLVSSWLNLGPVATLLQSSATLPLYGGMIALMAVGLFRLNMHLGKPHRFYRGFYNLKHSPVSREIAGITGFFSGLVAMGFLTALNAIWLQLDWLGILIQVISVLTLLSGFAGLYYMYRLYRIPARPYWDHWQTGASFVGTALSIGALFIGLVVLLFGAGSVSLIQSLTIIIALGLALEVIGLYFHHRAMQQQANEGAASTYLQSTQFGYPWLIRNSLLGINLLAALLISQMPLASHSAVLLGSIWVASVLASAVIGRSLFYAVVLPTTMPGAFFWKNAGFVDHARETGLADMPQIAVAYERHHPFKWDELLETVKQTLTKA